MHAGSKRLTWSHLATDSTWKIFLQSNQRSICMCVRLAEDVCSPSGNKNKPCVCVCVSEPLCGSLSDLRHLRPFKKQKKETDRTNSGGKTSGEKQQNQGGRVGVARWRGSAAIKAPKSRFHHSVALSGARRRDGLVLVCHYKTEKKEENTYVRHKMENINFPTLLIVVLSVR